MNDQNERSNTDGMNPDSNNIENANREESVNFVLKESADQNQQNQQEQRGQFASQPNVGRPLTRTARQGRIITGIPIRIAARGKGQIHASLKKEGLQRRQLWLLLQLFCLVRFPEGLWSALMLCRKAF
ncbi:MAG: hypothetical protein HFG43_08950 [Lachnospiraceae bacterium]|nr:hypothetical protein [Lachnospiraceae bacterium]